MLRYNGKINRHVTSSIPSERWFALDGYFMSRGLGARPSRATVFQGYFIVTRRLHQGVSVGVAKLTGKLTYT